MNKKVMVAGHICLDVTPQILSDSSDIHASGRLINVGPSVLSTGGPVSNTGLVMAKLGMDVKLNGKVGDDYFGDIIKSLVGRQRSSSFKTVSGQSTSTSTVLAVPGKDRTFLHYTGTNDTFTSDDIDYDTAGGCALFHFGYPPLMKMMYENGGAELTKMYKKINAMNVTTCLDMAVPDPNGPAGKADWKAILENTLAYVDIFVPSIEEIAYMLDPQLYDKRMADAADEDPVFAFRPEDFEYLADKIIEMGAAAVFIKSGVRGCFLKTAGAERMGKVHLEEIKDKNEWQSRTLWVPSIKPEKLASATGAGDATIAGFLCGILRGFGPEKTIRTASILGWQNIREFDTTSGIEDWDATLKYLDTLNEFNPARLGENWQWSDENKVFEIQK